MEEVTQEDLKLILYRMDQFDASNEHIRSTLYKVDDHITQLVAARAEDTTRQILMHRDIALMSKEHCKVEERVALIEKTLFELKLENAKRIALSSAVGGGMGGLVVFLCQVFDLFKYFQNG